MINTVAVLQMDWAHLFRLCTSSLKLSAVCFMVLLLSLFQNKSSVMHIITFETDADICLTIRCQVSYSLIFNEYCLPRSVDISRLELLSIIGLSLLIRVYRVSFASSFFGHSSVHILSFDNECAGAFQNIIISCCCIGVKCIGLWLES